MNCIVMYCLDLTKLETELDSSWKQRLDLVVTQIGYLTTDITPTM
jgi:hypothetical protein